MIAIEILPRIWVGDAELGKNHIFIKEKHINFAVNCTHEKNIIRSYNLCFDKYIFVDNVSRICNDLNEIVKKMYEVTHNFNHNFPNNVLIYCKDASSHSLIVMIAYLIKYARVNASSAIFYLKGKVNVNLSEITKYEQILKKLPRYLN